MGRGHQTCLSIIWDMVYALLMTLALGWDISLFAKLTLILFLNIFGIPLLFLMGLRLPLWVLYLVILHWAGRWLGWLMEAIEGEP